MDPLWMLAAEWWWIAPTAVGAGAVTAVGVRRGQKRSGRRLALDAARRDLRDAQREIGERRRGVKVARAEHARLVAERTASRASTADVASARRALRQAEHDAKAAHADVRARRIRVGVEQAQVPSASRTDRYPLARLNGAHDAVIARWMDYETDAAKLIAYPAMSDGKEPAMAAFLAAASRARDLRPSSPSGVTPAEFSAYRDAVADLERTFDVAEHTAKARAAGRDPDAATAWPGSAHEMLSRSAEALDKAAGAAAAALAAWTSRRRPKRDE
ncbi:hypothetical protein KEC56_08580 [Microbacterium sp. YMB-B2]|uniref:Uncharacterized protein n=1 Tax=Microbacterium tenebrionis TaxID=2830665 RepID=A0A9X1LPB5_9MICO|nr:hypothetical protein [Microbacterium tenebrionis]MCC2029572.1 hypothetical protein [Microbacterium tenebrionis]